MTDDQKTTPWIPVSKDVARLFPVDRPFTEIEALVSLQLDHNNDKPVTILGYAHRWQWSRKRVRGLFNRLRIEVEYPKDTARVQRQVGAISPSKQGTDKGTDKGQINFIDFRHLEAQRDRKGTDRVPQLKRTREREKKQGVSDPRIQAFDTWFHEKFNRRFRREYTVTSWPKHRGQIKKLVNLNMPWHDLLFLTVEFLLDDDPWLTEKAGHNLGTLLTRIGQNNYHRYLEADFRDSNQHHMIDEPRAESWTENG